VVESLNHAGTANDAVVDIKWVDSEELTDGNAAEHLSDCTGILVPGGFGDRGIEGMISAVRYARENNVPYFGICLGMQMAVIEFARHVVGFDDANSAEFSETTKHPVIALMPDQVNVTDKGGTMRLGKYPCVLKEGTHSYALYGASEISERHRHRFEFNNDFRAELSAKGMTLAGLSPDSRLVEIVELPDHPWFVGAQFHPEFKSRPDRPHPLFYGFVKAAVELAEKE
jgi:CTP synthase